MKRIILEMGTGNDLYGEDYTKAACRAVDDALHHSSITLFRSLGYDPAMMDVKVTVGVQSPESVSLKRVSGRLPHGKVVVKAVRGGLNVVDTDNNTISVIATAAVEAYIAIDETKWIPPRK